MINNKSTFQFATWYSQQQLTICCYHSTNRVVISKNNFTNYIGYEKLHNPVFESMTWHMLEWYLARQPHLKQITFEELLHMFLSK